jgi:RNA polymerase sigma-70 factor (ECF subfamily)
MFSVALRILKDRQEAEDILQDAFTDAFKNLKSFRGNSSFGTWLKRIVVNKSLNRVKKKRLEFSDIKEDSIIEEVEVNDYPRLSVSAIQGAVEQLADGFRVVLTLYLFEGLTHKEIAKELNISEGTSKSQYMRAKLKLKEILIHQYEE